MAHITSRYMNTGVSFRILQLKSYPPALMYSKPLKAVELVVNTFPRSLKVHPTNNW